MVQMKWDQRSNVSEVLSHYYGHCLRIQEKDKDKQIRKKDGETLKTAEHAHGLPSRWGL